MQVQLSELQPSELTDLVGRRKQHPQHQNHSAAMDTGPSAGSKPSRSSEKDSAQQAKADAVANGKDSSYLGLGSVPPPPPPPTAAASQNGPSLQPAGGRRPGAGVAPYDPTGSQARAAQQQQQAQNGPSAATQRPAPAASAGAGGAPSDGHQQLHRSGSAGYGMGAAPAGPTAPPAMVNGGRPRQDSGGVNTAQKLVGAALAAQQQQQQQFGGSSAAGVVSGAPGGGHSGGLSSHSGAAGILHSSYGEASTPSYRNATVAGSAVPVGSAAGTLLVSSASAASLLQQQQQQQQQGRGAAPPPSVPGGLGTPAKKPASLDEPSTPTGAPGTALQQQQQQARGAGPHLNHAAAEYGGHAGARLMMQQQAQQQQQSQAGLTFGTAPNKVRRV